MHNMKSSFIFILPKLCLNVFRYVLLSRKKWQVFLRHMLAELKSAASSIESIHLHDIPGVTGTSVVTMLKGGAVVALIAKAMDAKQVFEFGTYLGETTMEIATNCPSCEIVTLDLCETLANSYEKAKSSSNIEITDEYLFIAKRGSVIEGEPAKRIHQIRQDSAEFDPTSFVNRFDLIYIDASHSYSAVRSDTEKAFVMLRPGGAIIWDDYMYSGIWAYLNELAEERPDIKLRYVHDWGKVVMLPA